jgi:hypothetical protein
MAVHTQKLADTSTHNLLCFLKNLWLKLQVLSIRWRVRHGKRLQPSVVKSGKVVIKCGPSISLTKAVAMQFIAENTSVPVPRVIATYDTPRGVKYLVTEYIDGITLERAFKTLKPEELTAICQELRGYVNQIRKLTPPKPLVVAGAVDSSPCMDPRLSLTRSDLSNVWTTSIYSFAADNENHPHPKIRELIRAHKSEKYRNFRIVLYSLRLSTAKYYCQCWKNCWDRGLGVGWLVS